MSCVDLEEKKQEGTRGRRWALSKSGKHVILGNPLGKGGKKACLTCPSQPCSVLGAALRDVRVSTEKLIWGGERSLRSGTAGH